MRHNPFTRSGALRLNHPLFRGRASELARLEQACLSDLDFFLLVYGGRQNGKTTVLLRLEAKLHERSGDGVRVCRVDFQGLPRATSPEAYLHLARSAARVLPNAPRPPETLDAPALGDFLEDALAGAAVQRLVLLLDELGTLPDATREDLAHVLRALHTRRLSSLALAKAQFVLAGGIELYRLAVVEASALRNVCEIERLGDLGEADAVAVIADGLALVGVAPTSAHALGLAVYERVGGHPYFTQRLGELLAAQQIAGDEPPDEAAVENLAWALLEQDDPLLEHLRRSIADLKLEDAARRLLSGSQRTSRTDNGIERLDLLGVARRSGRHWVPRSPLFSVALAEWLGLPLPIAAAMPTAAKAVRTRALAQYLDELRLEQRAVTSHTERATSPAEQVRLQRRIHELADELTRVEALQQVMHVGAPLTATSPDGTNVNTPPPVPGHGSESRSQGVRASLPPWVPVLVKVPAGPFLMGRSDADTMAEANEKLQHTLTLPDYWIGKTPVTNAQFRPFVEGDGYTNPAYWTKVGWEWRAKERIVRPGFWNATKWNGDDYPVVGVSWFESVAYCRWLSVQTGHAFRLPTEAEWEKAARGTDGRIWPWGNTWESGRCNSKEAGHERTTPVDQYPIGASPYGVLDMAGNIWEWCATQQSGKRYLYQLEDEWQAAYLEADKVRKRRGGSWYSEQKFVRASYSNDFYPRNRNHDYGLRVASHAPLPGSES
ncbi:SUMF1/EgtB/PvdO family nonheme iron enzyme [Candidatus Chloroploca sp. M-50]|uniref:SUMF1/EgtB/PvdO family nonheme iron enzyme n=1 Tax=Candidatus Chloroploca mongolica TaxID=2528176 RepID=A0ABS4DA16_9CHLR|nr:SUMF1/EgtB/PvdO family nonheme iron enzyme [Candidatus Chloroploca mongolica]MBP1466273.1 SUMF1/EgtB/PvdO family nonheme iron enzyme [Candidatus Chloroploca mongolica]